MCQSKRSIQVTTLNCDLFANPHHQSSYLKCKSHECESYRLMLDIIFSTFQKIIAYPCGIQKPHVKKLKFSLDIQQSPTIIQKLNNGNQAQMFIDFGQ